MAGPLSLKEIELRTGNTDASGISSSTLWPKGPTYLRANVGRSGVSSSTLWPKGPRPTFEQTWGALAFFSTRCMCVERTLLSSHPWSACPSGLGQPLRQASATQQAFSTSSSQAW